MTPEDRERMVETGLLAGTLRKLRQASYLEREGRLRADMLMLRAWDAGATDRVIAEAMNVSIHTAKARRQRALRYVELLRSEPEGAQARPRIRGRRAA